MADGHTEIVVELASNARTTSQMAQGKTHGSLDVEYQKHWNGLDGNKFQWSRTSVQAVS